MVEILEIGFGDEDGLALRHGRRVRISGEGRCTSGGSMKWPLQDERQ